MALHSNTGNARFYSFNRGLTHFIVFTAEAYLYARNAAFLAEAMAQEIIGTTEDVKEGVASFLEKRPSSFKGQ